MKIIEESDQTKRRINGDEGTLKDKSIHMLFGKNEVIKIS